MKVLHLSTWKEYCGIATYTEQLVNSLDKLGIESEVYPVNRKELAYFSLEEIEAYFLAFCQKAAEFDLIHIQHEHGFFHGSYPFSVSVKVFNLILKSLRKTKKPIFITFHTEPAYFDSYSEDGVGLKGKLLLKTKKYIALFQWRRQVSKFFQRSRYFVAIVHSKKSRLQLLKSGFDRKSIQVLTHAFPKRGLQSTAEDTRSSKRKLGLSEESIVLSIFGFVSEYKGYKVAIRALSHLPDNFVLAIVGGPHPEAVSSDAALDNVFETIESVSEQQPSVAQRVLVTGYVETEQLNEFHKATDICLAPYLPSSISASGALTWALTSGKPVIASNIPAFRELNQNAACLLLVQPNAYRELAWRIQRLIEDAHAQQELVNRAALYTQSHTWEATAKSLKKLYEVALGKAKL